MSFRNAKVHFKRMDSDAYHADYPARGDAKYPVSPSMLKAFGQACPARWIGGYESPKSEAMKFGSLVDVLFLTPERFEEKYSVTPATYTATVMRCPVCGGDADSKSCKKCKADRVETKTEKAWNNNAEFCRGWIEQQEGKEIVSATLLEEARAATKSLSSDKHIKELLDCSDAQVLVTGEWHDDNGLIIPVRCLIDLVPRKDSVYAYALADLKTVQSAKPEAFEDTAYKFGYDIQAAFDLDLFNAATSEGRGQWCWPLVEAYAPFAVGRRFDEFGSSSQFLDNGRARYRRLLKLYCQCLKSGVWPGYDDTGEASNGWTIVRLKPWRDEAQLDHPKFITYEPEVETVPAESGDDITL